MINIDYGKIKLNLNKIIEEKNISKNKLAQRTEMQRTQLNKYCNQNIQRIDLSILARLCYVLECEISDIIEYIPPEE
ncbi:MAG TPA: helix-turn-helix transcriptional regulator [Candidatus Fimicola cottocaccae]|uniref:helix-turn-helix domain-containing protein n=1 Tax=Tyzzerella sp. An114 TaxID=1965545 RepID=UPI0019D4258A|nr:helix-turn-helix transcriptional regulator [Tyzzerella sp. An114]HIT72943.1 helix-turn-helix transcriptional regulator [Candidatus Fimicola cottocaccae]